MDDITLKSVRIKQRLDNLTRAYHQLADALARDTASDELLRGGLIQFFEFTFELCWKTMKDMLEVDGISVAGPRDVIREAFSLGYVVDGKTWIEMLDARNSMTHVYDEQSAALAEREIRVKYTPLIKEFYDYVTNTWLGR